MISSTLSFVTGVLLLQQLTVLPNTHWLVVSAAFTAILYFFRLRVFAWFLLGFTWAMGFAIYNLSDTLNPSLEGNDLIVEGIVIDLPQKFEKGFRFNFDIQTVIFPELADPPGKVRISWYQKSIDLKAGQRWRFKLKLKRPHGNLNPGGFDYEQWLFIHHINATGYVKNSRQNHLLNVSDSWFSLQSWRQSINDRLSNVLLDSQMQGLIKALTIGNRNAITSGQWKVFRRTGTTHLIAISGLHIGLVAGLAFFLGRRLWSMTGILVWAPPKVAAVITFSVAFLYSAMANFSVPTQRALIMIAVVMGGIFLQRNLNPGRILSIAMFLVVLYDPFAVLSVGFWLSFLAVMLITFALTARVGPSGYWRAMLRVQWVVTLGLSPLLLLFFQQVSIIAPIANLVAVPLVSLLIVPFCLLGTVLLMLMPSLGQVLLEVGDQILHILWNLLVWLSGMNFSQWNHSQPSLYAILLAMTGILLIISPKGVPSRWLGLILLIPLIWQKHPRPEQGDVWFNLLDVGQGLAAIVQTRNHLLVFDAGARYSDRFDLGASVIVPFLQINNLTTIDTLIISHGDNDHIGGARSLFNSFPINQTLTSVPKQISWATANLCQAGQNWWWDGVRFTILSPFGQVYRSKNDNSCVLKIIGTGGSILLTGDIEEAAEKRLLQEYGEELASTILVVPHHGSKTSSTLLFLDAVMPEYALIPAGYRNRFGFPKKEIVERYQGVDAKVYNTATTGTIQIRLESHASDLQPELYRNTHGKYWNVLAD